MDKKIERKLSPLFTWRSVICSDDGPEDPITRWVLIALSLHMNELGDSCFPSIALLARETALANRTVKKHLKLAAEAGWILRRLREQRRGQAWRCYEYYASTGRRGAADAPPSQAHQPNQELTNKVGQQAPHLGDVGHLTTEGGASDGKKVGHHVHPSTSLSTSRGRQEQGAQNCANKTPPRDMTIEEWLKIPEAQLSPSERALREHYAESTKKAAGAK